MTRAAARQQYVVVQSVYIHTKGSGKGPGQNEGKSRTKHGQEEGLREKVCWREGGGGGGGLLCMTELPSHL